MAGENEEMVAGATNSSLTPRNELTRREIRERERIPGMGPTSANDELLHSDTHQASSDSPRVDKNTETSLTLSRRELRLKAQGQEIIEANFPSVLANTEGNHGGQEGYVQLHSPVTVPNLDEGTKAGVEPENKPFPVEDVATELQQPIGEEPIAHRKTIAQTAASRETVADPVARPHKLIKRVSVRRPAFLSNRSKRDRSAADKRRQISQRVVSVLALLACFAFALSISIPANALLTQQDVAQMKMQSFLDEQVSLASQSVNIDSGTGTTTASRDGVDVTLAKVTPEKVYGSSGLCGAETSVNPPASTGRIIWPLENTVISSPYGYRWGSLHAGIDFEGPTGTPIYAAADGIVMATMPSPNNSLGICAIISHNVNGVRFDTLYGHMSRMDIGVGQAVSAGQIIGAVGSTGNSTGPHLHFEVHVNGVQIDPAPFMSNYAG